MAQRKAETQRYAIYLRCSSDDQAQGDFTTIDTQREINTQHVVQAGGTLVKEYADEGKSGTNLKRTRWKQLLEDANAGLFDVVCVTYMSRLARGDSYHVAEYLLKEAGVRVELVREKFTPDLAGHVNRQMTILMDGMYPKMVSQWTKTKQEQMVAHGFYCGGIVPFGYTAESVESASFVSRNEKEPPKRLVPDADTAPFLRCAFEVFVETRSYTRVVEYLRSVTARKWTINAVTHILKNDVYRGVLRFGENVNYTAFEPIVSEALWDEVQAAKSLRLPRSPKQNRTDTAPYYLRGLVYCSYCGGRMTPAAHHGRNGRVRYYECMSSMKKLTTGCPTRRVNAFALHTAVLAEIGRCAQHPTRISGYVAEAVKLLPTGSEAKPQLTAVKKRLAEVEKKIGQITAAIESGGAMRSLVERLGALETERVKIEVEAARLNAQVAEQAGARPDAKRVAELWSNFLKLWEGMTEEEREQVMSLLVERVSIVEKEKGTCQIRIFDKSLSRMCNLPETKERG